MLTTQQLPHLSVSKILLQLVKDYFSPLVAFYEALKLAFYGQVDDYKSLKKKELELRYQIESLMKELNKYLDTDTKVSANTFSSSKNEANFVDEALNNTHRYLDYKKHTIFEKRLPKVTLNLSELTKSIKDIEPRWLSSEYSVLTMAAAEVGIANIEYIISKVRKNLSMEPVLFGLNKGGSFLSSYLVNRLGFHKKNSSRCDITDYKTIICHSREILAGETIIILDDISRSGESLRFAKKELIKQFPGTRIYVTVLTMTVDENLMAAYEVDYAAWITPNRDLKLPWSGESESSIKEFEFNEIEVDQFIDSLEYKSLNSI